MRLDVIYILVGRQRASICFIYTRFALAVNSGCRRQTAPLGPMPPGRGPLGGMDFGKKMMPPFLGIYAICDVLMCTWSRSCDCYTGILYLARRSKYHLSIWPLSRVVLIPRLDEFIFFVVSQFLLQVLSRSSAPLPPFVDFSSFFPHPGRGIFPSLPGFTTHACFLKRCALCC